MNILCQIFLALVVFCNVLRITVAQDSFADNAPANITFYIEHSFGNNKFTPRTRIQLVYKADGRQGLMYLDKNLIANDDIAPFKNVVQRKGLYTIRIRTERENWQGHFVLSSIPVCDLQGAGFKEDIQAFLDANGNIISISYSAPPVTIAQECDASKLKDSVALQTRIKIGEELAGQAVPLQVQGPRPPYLHNAKLGVEEDQKQQQHKPQQSFLQKYWYIVLALVLYMLVGGGGAPAEAGKEGAAGADGAKPAAKKE